MTASSSEVNELRAAASAFLALDVLAIESAVAARVLPLVEGIAAGIVAPTTLQAALGGDRRAIAPARSRSPIAVVPLDGVLTPRSSIFTLLGMGTAIADFMRNLRAADDDPDVTTVAIPIDSPGGSVQLIPEAAALLRSVRARKPVIALVTGCCCSAAYWLSANTSRILATQSGVVGSLGIIGERVSVARRLATEGVEVALFATSPAKTWGHPATAVSDEERAHAQARVDEVGHQLERDVAQGRRVSIDRVHRTFGQGKTFSASMAHGLGMIDAVTLDDLAEVLVAESARARTEAARTLTALSHARARFAHVALAPHRAALAALKGGAHT